MKLINLFTALTLSSLSFAANIDVNCLSAAGYYGAVRVKQVGNEVNIYVKSGVRLHPGKFLEELQVEVPPGHVFSLRITVPASSCQVAGPAILSCMASDVKGTYRIDGNVEHTFELSGVNVQLANVVTTIVHGKLNQTEATIIGTRPVGNDYAQSTMVDRFGAPGGPSHSACTVN